MNTRFLPWLATSLAILIAGSQATAQGRNEVKALQFALAQHGLYSGTVDGLDGPGTRAAIRSFAERFGIEASFWPVASKMSVNTTWEVEWTDAVEKAVIENLETSLLDARSARIDDRILYRTNNGASACIKVNAKNALGAYTGYHWLFFSIVEVNYPESSLLKLDDTAFAVGPAQIEADTAEAWCMLGYVLERNE